MTDTTEQRRPEAATDYTPVELANGYRVNGKYIVAAYGIEAAIIGSGLFAGYQFANRYGSDDTTAYSTQVASLTDAWFWWAQPWTNDTWWMMVIAAFALCVAEAARVPLAQAFRTQRGFWARFGAILGVGLMCIITTKTMSQVMEQMFHPRLRYVQTTSAEVAEAKGKLERAERGRDSEGNITDPRVADVKSIDEKIIETQKSLQEMGKKPSPVCTKGYYTKAKKKKNRAWVKGKCTQPTWPGDVLFKQLEDLQKERDAATSQRDLALQRTNALNGKVDDAKLDVIAAEKKHLEAVSNSQLHSFTGMFFGKDPREVTDGEVHFFLRLFVFIPAIALSLASSLLVMSAYRTIRLPKAKAREAELDVTFQPTLRDHIDDLINNRTKPQEA